MDYANMSLLELKQAAKGRRIKQYYILRRTQLIEILSMKELPLTMKVEKMTIHELREEARRRGMRGFWSLRRDRLVELLYPQEGDVHQAAANQNHKNEGGAEKHNHPQQNDAHEVGVENTQDSRNDRFDDMDLDA